MEFRFNGINVYYNGELSIKNLEIRISYQTTLIFIGGSHIFSAYFVGLDSETIAELLKDCFEEYGIETSEEEVKKASEWIKAHL